MVFASADRQHVFTRLLAFGNVYSRDRCPQLLLWTLVFVSFVIAKKLKRKTFLGAELQIQILMYLWISGKLAVPPAHTQRFWLS